MMTGAEFRSVLAMLEKSRPRRRTKVLRITGRVLVLLLVGAALAGAYTTGLLGMTLGMLLTACAVVSLILVVTAVVRRRVFLAWWRQPLRAGNRRYLAQVVLRSTVWIMAGYLAVLGFPTSQTTPEWASISRAVTWLAVVVLVLAALAPQRRVGVLRTVGFGVAMLIMVVQVVRLTVPAEQPVLLGPPMRGTWLVTSGGDSGLVSHHYPVRQQRDALDLTMPVDRSAGLAPTELNAYPAYRQPVFSPADGVVSRAVDGLPEQAIGSRDPVHATGNHVVIDLGDGRFVLLAHLRSGTVRVAAGDLVRSGDLLGEVGNSGNTVEPHLHIQVQSGPELQTDDGRIVDVVTFPMRFHSASRVRSGKSTALAQDLRRNDLVRFEPAG
jgi:hypothetical protein